MVPCPSVLDMDISPSIRATMRRTMDNPSPAPPCLRDTTSSTWVNGSKMVASMSSGMPMPVSSTSTVSVPLPPGPRGVSYRARSRTWPRSVNFTALPTMFSSIWRMRTGSPSRPGGTPSAVASSTMFLRSASGRSTDCTSCASAAKSNGSSRMVSRPDSTPARSSRSPSRRVRVLPAAWATCT